MNRSWLGLVATCVYLGCGGAAPRQIVSSRGIASASGAPFIQSIIDLGDVVLPSAGMLPVPDTDRAFVVGELLLIEGDRFGKQPAVSVGGRPAVILARTGNGGIVTRVPPAVATGRVDVQVSHAGGRHAMPIDVRRHALVVEPAGGVVHVVSLGRRGVDAPTATIELTGARDVAFSAGGQVALVAADAAGGQGSRAGILAMSASGRPRLVRELRLDMPEARMVACAAQAPVCAIAGGAQVTLLDLEDPRTPARHAAHDLAPHAGPGARVTGMALSPDGAWLAVLLDPENTLVPVDIRAPAAPRRLPPIVLEPEARVPLARELSFSPTGDELWILAGDTAEALSTGEHPAQLVIVAPGEREFVVRRTVELAGVPAPLALAVTTRESLGAGTAIRSRESRAAVAIAAVDRAVLRGQPAPQAASRVVRTDLEGNTEELAADAGVITALAMNHDASHVVAVTARGQDLGLLTVPLQAGGTSTVPAAARPGATLPSAAGAPSFVALPGARPAAALVPGAIALAP